MTFKIKIKPKSPKDMPREMEGLWRFQYKPREKVLLKIMDEKQKKKWEKLNYFSKMRIIDDMQKKGYFE